MTRRWVLAAAWLSGCVTLDPLAPRPDAGSCSAACDRGRDLGCDYAQPIDGESCEAVCNDAEAFKPGTFQAGCLSEIQSCDEVEACGNGRR